MLSKQSGKVYFVEFTRKPDILTDLKPITFYKFGFTSKDDVAYRMERIIKPFPGKFKYKILCSIWLRHSEDAKKLESILINRYPKPKALWIPEKLSGITECTLLTDAQRLKVMDGMYKFKKTMEERYGYVRP